MKNTLDRRSFTLEAALAMLSGVAITVSGCGGGSSNNPSNPTPTPAPTPAPTPGPVSDRTGAVSANHGHRAVLTGAQLTAGGGVSLDIQGDSGHPHTLTLSGGDIMAIAAGQQVSRESTNNSGHTHNVTFN
jgi:hypothetical protein